MDSSGLDCFEVIDSKKVTNISKSVTGLLLQILILENQHMIFGKVVPQSSQLLQIESSIHVRVDSVLIG